LRRRAERVSQGAFVVSDPQPLPPDYAPLSMSEFESDVALRYVSGRALVGEQATTAAVMSGLAGATLAHFSCHGFVDKRIDYSGVLVLANGELLTYQHLRNLSFLVVFPGRPTIGLLRPPEEGLLPLAFALGEARKASVKRQHLIRIPQVRLLGPSDATVKKV
jgi:CHAT domain